MAIVLNHTIIPAKDKRAAARFFADTFGLTYDASDDHSHFAPVRVNDALTLLFDNTDAFDGVALHSAMKPPENLQASGHSLRVQAAVFEDAFAQACDFAVLM